MLKNTGAEMTQAIATAGADVPATAGVFAKIWDTWIADGTNAEAKSLWLYKGVGYQARTAIQKIETYAPDLAVNNYAVRPIPAFPSMPIRATTSRECSISRTCFPT